MTSRFKKYKNTILNEEIKNVFSILSYNKKKQDIWSSQLIYVILRP